MCAVLTVLKTKSQPSGRPKHYLRGPCGLNGPHRIGSSTWSRHFMEAAVFGSGLDDPIDDARHLGCHGHIGHALAVGAGGVFPEISLELVTKTVLGLADGDRGRQPEGTTQSRVTVLG